MEENHDPRDAIIAELKAHIQNLMEDARDVAEVTDQVIGEQEQLHKAQMEEQRNRLKSEAIERDNAFKREVNAVYASYIDTQAAVLEALQRGSGVKGPAANVLLPQLEALSNKIAHLSKSVELVLDGGHPGPLLSVALEEWINVRGGLGIDPKKVDTDYNRIKDFIAFAGDLAINKYRYLNFQPFANMLAHVPASYSVKPEFRGMTQVEAVKHNGSLPPAKRHKTVTGKTIETNYMSSLYMIFHDMCANNGFPSPFANVAVRISADARGSPIASRSRFRS